MATRRRGLGRGLDALLNTDTTGGETTGHETTGHETGGRGLDQAEPPARATIAIDRIRRSPFQPRRRFDEQALSELAESIRRQGVLQPIIVRPLGDGQDYELVVGERRWRAAQQAGLDALPAIVRRLDDQEVAAVALVENIQREDLNPLEEAQGLRRLLQEFGYTHQQVADAVGRSRASVSNLLRLLELSAPVQDMLANGDLEMGHARALLSLGPEAQLGVARQVTGRGLSVRETERVVRKTLAESRPVSPSGRAPAARAAGGQEKGPDLVRLEQELSESLGARTEVRDQDGRGELVIRYASLDQLEGILARLRVSD